MKLYNFHILICGFSGGYNALMGSGATPKAPTATVFLIVLMGLMKSVVKRRKASSVQSASQGSFYLACCVTGCEIV